MNNAIRFGLLLLLLFFDVPVKAQSKVELLDVDNTYLTGFLGTRNKSRINFIENAQLLESRLGFADSVERYDTMLYSASSNGTEYGYLYYTGFSVSRYLDTTVIDAIDFTVNKQLKLVCGKIELSYETKLSDFKKFYPRSYRKGQQIKKASERYYELRLSNEPDSAYLILVFNKAGHLVSVVCTTDGCC